jgi:hypothetical protein
MQHLSWPLFLVEQGDHTNIFLTFISWQKVINQFSDDALRPTSFMYAESVRE